jgi:hypothetical protein
MPDGRKLHRASTDKLLELPTNSTPGAWPPYTELSGVRVYFIHVRVTLTKADLTNPDAA